jgi:Rho guanine nucleotide exchange factor 17
MSVVFSKPEKRTHWEETFTETKQKLIASIERFAIPDFIASIPIRKTRAGLQFTCAAATLGAQKDVWVCNSDGYVGQVCVLSLNQPEPTVTSCNGVCNARILCVTSVPGNSDCPVSSITANEDQNRSSLLSISNSSTISNKTLSGKSMTQSDSNIRLDSSSSSDSETEASLTATTVASNQERSMSPSSVMSNTSQAPLCDDGESQMWLGTEDGFIHVYNCTDNIRIKKNKIKIQHASAVYSILYLDSRVFVSLANGDIYVYSRKDSVWNTSNPLVLSIGSSVTCPVTKLLNVYGKLWCAIANCIKIINTSTLQVI